MSTGSAKPVLEYCVFKAPEKGCRLYNFSSFSTSELPQGQDDGRPDLLSPGHLTRSTTSHLAHHAASHESSGPQEAGLLIAR
ncbi:uncharacterized protein BDCG_03293 [Blastomyces dermatitidis ER-3]|uniref:Uncharacterized protein n=1 Tax=Ajellomyces dermatitidis (strain ER-3 / ATCC MYA-2586) TaxID=559297 RepID=A0ABP2EXX5_AJEDR|nr:uncharacterized protein BDCG_03293 [Blastomyces dermatitidis ER-3]EEQ88173.1 hypothetical protein BDCG_03293 [Blastomyces dermatitidis ER-3]EQL32144.1 hypothetical protein BDFG_05626 [Blastomyces dermatitidis ATCC 26199]